MVSVLKNPKLELSMSFMEKRSQGNPTVFGKFLAVITALEACPNHASTARDLVLAHYGTSGDGNSNYRDQTEMVITELGRAGIVRYDRARGRISTVKLIDTGCLDSIADDVRVVESRAGHRGEVSYMPAFPVYVSEYRQEQKLMAAERRRRRGY